MIRLSSKILKQYSWIRLTHQIHRHVDGVQIMKSFYTQRMLVEQAESKALSKMAM